MNFNRTKYSLLFFVLVFTTNNLFSQESKDFSEEFEKLLINEKTHFTS